MHKQNVLQAVPPPTRKEACAVRLGKLVLQSMDFAQLFSNPRTELKHVVTVHSEIFVYAHENPTFGAILERTVNTIDGRIVHFLCSAFYPGRKLRKLSGSDFIYNLAEYAAMHGESVFLLGAEAASNRGAIEVLKSRCPDLIVDGYSPAFCDDISEQSWNQDIIRKIGTVRPSHLVVCFGAPRQEMWISRNADLLFGLGVRCAYGLGGTLDFVSQRKRRAPRWIQNVGAEWLFRFFCEPRRRLTRTAKMFKMPYFAWKFRQLTIEATNDLVVSAVPVSDAHESLGDHASISVSEQSRNEA